MSRPHARFLDSARLIAVWTLLSRITGLARDVTLNHIYGQNWVQDAFNYGFLVPNLFRRLFGEGALLAVFVPVFTDVIEKKGRPAAWVLLGRVTGLMALALCAAVVVLELGALAVAMTFETGRMANLQIHLTALMIPFMIGVCLIALFSSILHCLNHFTTPAALSIVLNGMIITGAVLVGPLFGPALERQIYGIGLCVIAASLVQLAIILPVLRGHGVQFRLSLDRDDPDLRRMVRLFLPIMLGQGVLLFNVFFDAQICTFLTRGPGDPAAFSLFGRTIDYPLAKGALSAVNNAQRLYQFPLGVLAISLATAAFPTFSRYATREDVDGLRSAVAQALRLAIFVGLPSGVILILLGRPIITLLFEHGNYGRAETDRAADVLRWYGLGMTAFCAQHILFRAFYSLKDTTTPMKISCWLVGLNLILNLVLVWRVREAAFGISTAITATLHMGISFWLLSRRFGGSLDAAAIAGSVMKTAVSTAAAGITAYVVHARAASLDASELGRTLAAAIPVVAPLGAAVAAFFLVGRVLGMEEIGWLLSRRVKASATAGAT